MGRACVFGGALTWNDTRQANNAAEGLALRMSRVFQHGPRRFEARGFRALARSLARPSAFTGLIGDAIKLGMYACLRWNACQPHKDYQSMGSQCAVYHAIHHAAVVVGYA